ncbi:uncharacterized protein [Mytilus edulis]|uniref:uncharacterized protein n=1 Tax=Mytilus edulis TaxID=6550 RepID=UPI0039F0681C
MAEKELMTDMQKMAGMSTEEYESLNFYKYLCSKIGSEEVVKIRRLTTTMIDMGQTDIFKNITSGSKGEGLYFKSSDFDLMGIDPFFKEIVEKHEDLKGLLCSYFLKTLMFWISEETDQNLWKPYNIITCFLSCLQRLLYCVKYSILPHYFISDNNFFCARFNVMNKEKLITILKNLNEQGINCFKSSETLQDYPRLSFHIPESFGVIRIIPETFSYVPSIKNMHLLYHFLHSSRTGLSRGLFAIHLSNACKFTLDTSKHRYSSENKKQYLKYKFDLSHLLIGVNSDAVSGWLTLASFFYVHKNYVASLSVVNYTLQKYTDEKFYTVLTTTEDILNHFQKQELNLMKKEKLYTIYKTLTIFPLQFYDKSSIISQELRVDVDVTNNHATYHPIGFAYFLSFLCYYHGQDITSCRHFLQLLKSTVTYPSLQADIIFTCSPLFCGIAHQLLGETNFARQMFQLCAMFDSYNSTSAASRLQGLI